MNNEEVDNLLSESKQKTLLGKRGRDEDSETSGEVFAPVKHPRLAPHPQHLEDIEKGHDEDAARGGQVSEDADIFGVLLDACCRQLELALRKIAEAHRKISANHCELSFLRSDRDRLAHELKALRGSAARSPDGKSRITCGIRLTKLV
jgi:hypothetical protein